MNTQSEEIVKRLLENQEVILLALTDLHLSKIGESKYDQSVIHRQNMIIDCYHETRRILGKEYIDRYNADNI